MSEARQGRLFEDLPATLADERVDTLVRSGDTRIERIVSTGQTTAEGDWYDQAWDEWVCVIAGAAAVLIEGERVPRTLQPGDWLFLPAHCRHRVTWTAEDRATVWLAVHVGEAQKASGAGAPA